MSMNANASLLPDWSKNPSSFFDHKLYLANQFGPLGPPPGATWPKPTMRFLIKTMGAQYTGLGVETSSADIDDDGTSVILLCNSPFIKDNNLVWIEGWIHYPDTPYPTMPSFICYPNFKAEGVFGKKYKKDLRIYGTSHDTNKETIDSSGRRPLAVEQQIIRGVFR